MKKCALLFILLIVAIFVFKANAEDSVNDSPSKELVSLSEQYDIAKN